MKKAFCSKSVVLRCIAILTAVFVSFVLLPAISFAGTDSQSGNAYERLPWKKGPTTVEVGGIGTLIVPVGCMYVGEEGARQFMELSHNPPSSELGVLIGNSERGTWWASFEFDEIGYVKDDEKGRLDSDAILKSIREGTESSNVERKKRGWSEMEVIGWSTPPNYNSTTHNLEWGIRGREAGTSGDSSISENHAIRALGRSGVLRCAVIADPQIMPAALTQFSGVLEGFKFNPGKGYSEFKEGDKIAAVGLTGLIVGGAAVAVAKSGLLTKFFKPILIAVFAFFASVFRAIGNFFARIFGRKDENTPT